MRKIVSVIIIFFAGAILSSCSAYTCPTYSKAEKEETKNI